MVATYDRVLPPLDVVPEAGTPEYNHAYNVAVNELLHGGDLDGAYYDIAVAYTGVLAKKLGMKLVPEEQAPATSDEAIEAARVQFRTRLLDDEVVGTALVLYGSNHFRSREFTDGYKTAVRTLLGVPGYEVEAQADDGRVSAAVAYLAEARARIAALFNGETTS